MATQLEQPKRRTAGNNTARIDGYVSNQLKKTTQQVRVSDIATGLLTLATFIVGFFLTVAIVDAWILPLNTTTRILALGILLIGIAVVAWFQLIPYFYKKINPQFAAKMIEETKPDFKNSLLNYLSLKKIDTDKKLHRAILGEVSKKAATDLSTISPDAAVDKSNLIRVGFVLVALVASLIGYSILSPKNPLPTFMRVLSPGSKISQPAAVSIEVLTPKDADVFFGDKPEVTAKIDGVDDQNLVRLIYSTTDQQIVDAQLDMKYTGTGNIYSAVLDTGPTGIQHSLTYYVAAGDGVSPNYSISVRPNPSITVNSIRITPPKYTGLPDRVIEGQGEIQAVEGSQIEITATANLPIQLAYIVPLYAKGDTPANTQYRELRSIQMKSEDQSATGRFTAGLNSNRDRQLFTHYKINFRSQDDFKNERPNIYPIRVIADLAPEIEFVAPATLEITTPVNRPLPIEIWASDLDYQLSAIDMHVDHNGHQILHRNLFDWHKVKATSDRVQVRSAITPQKLGLKPGDKAILYAVASDNRISATSDLSDPNQTRSDNYTLIITDPVEEQQQPDEKKDESPDRQKSQENPEQQRRDSTGDEKQGNPSEDGADSKQNQTDQSQEPTGEPGEDSQSDSGDSEGGKSSDSASDGSKQNTEQQGDPSSDSSSSDGDSDDESGSDQEAGRQDDQTDGGEKDGNSSEQSDSSESSSQSRSSDGSDGKITDAADQDSSDGSTDSTGGSEQGSSDQNGRRGDAGDQESKGDAGGKETRDDSLQDGEQQPLSEDAHPGEKFERLKDYFDKNKDKQKGRSQPNDDNTDNQSKQRGDQESTNEDSQGNQSPDTEQEPEKASDGAANGGERAQDADRDDRPEQDSNASGGDNPVERKDPKSEQQNPGSSNSGDKPQQETPSQQENTGSGTKSNSDLPDQQSDSSSKSGDPDSEPSNSSGNPKTDNGNSQNESQQTSNSGSDSENSTVENQDSRSQQPSNQTGNNHSDAGDQDGQPDESNSQETGSSSQSNSDSAQGSPSTNDSGNADQSASRTQQPSGNDASDKTMRGGNAGNNQSTGREKPESDAPKKDEANLEYAKKVTDLVLDELEDQKYDPDQELLEQMNWTQQDLDAFLKQWQQMKANAESGNPTARKKYAQALESLGITPKTKSRQARVQKEKEFRLSENGAVDQVPREYLEKFNSFLKRRNRSRRK